ncbi:MAG: phage portal protein [Bradyrhizobium sp.]
MTSGYLNGSPSTVRLAVRSAGSAGSSLSSTSICSSATLAHQIETAWAQWSNSATEADASGRHTLHQLAAAGFRSYLLTGETLFTLGLRLAARRRAPSCVLSIAASSIFQSHVWRKATASIMQGVQFDSNVRLQGYHIRKFILGSFASAPQAQYVAAAMSWGRPRVGHLFDLLVAGQVRGMSPLAAALTQGPLWCYGTSTVSSACPFARSRARCIVRK